MPKRKAGKRAGKTLIAEAEALVLYIARRGDMLGDDSIRMKAFEELQNAIATAKAGSDTNYQGLFGAYSRLSAITYSEYGVNGRTILDTLDARNIWRLFGRERAEYSRRLPLLRRARLPRNRPLLIAVSLLLAVGLFEGALIILHGNQERKDVYFALVEAKEMLRPLVWGALGTCTFLMKTLSDKLSDFTYEETRTRGVGSRVILGAILGLILVELTSDSLAGLVGAEESVPRCPDQAELSCEERIALLREREGMFPVYLIAFLGGLGIKPVYSAIEQLIEGLAARIKPPARGDKS